MNDTLRALRLYASPVFFRENPTLISAAVYLAITAFNLAHPSRTHPAGIHDIGLFWWMAQQGVFTGLSCQYWRQVRSPLAAMYPRLIAAEYRAIHVMLVLGLLLLAVPALILGLPLLNVLALESVNLAISTGSDLTGPKILRPRLRKIRVVIVFGLFFMFMSPTMQDTLMRAPWFLALGLLATTLSATLIELHHSPFAHPDTPAPAIPRPDHKPPNAVFRSLKHALMWQPPPLRRIPLPNGLASGSPLGMLAQSAVTLIVFTTFVVLVNAISSLHAPTLLLVRTAATATLGQVAMLGAMPLPNWMLSRRDWPFLLSLGPFGARSDFTRALYRAHAGRAVMAGTILGLFAAITVTLLGTMPPLRALAAGLALAAVIVGGSYLPSLAVFSPLTNRPGFILVLSMLGSLAGIQIYTTLLFVMSPVPPLAWALPVMAIAFALVMARLAPRALARADWPIEPPAL
ncbi:hypothetical protein HLH26_14195 [Gluconacetobacter sp. 1b LMG 1731]|uniref:Uncharacterized protein n=1 Tax=Gluconacetobacter dulcium TaxID=2729096 RepID=A0A7W4IMN0_9PROT|nr:hypothetical protein [Gluconacetobacter dulcium]MBB2165663.1 hypothetical protein [Gluconacetobacter dulcium]MBB2194753.1 hypothetical protein [Gluconacetobacter dulcium]